MRIFTELVIDSYGDFLKEYNIKFASDSWSAHINLTEFIIKYPMPKIANLILLISEADTIDDATKGYNHIFECIDYISKTPYNSRKSIAKKLQRINDFTMSHQSTFEHNWHVLQLHKFSKNMEEVKHHGTRKELRQSD